MLHKLICSFSTFAKNKGMKRKLFFIISLVLISISFTSCGLIGGDCEVCRYASYDSSTGSTTYTDEIEYCGAELLAMKSTGSSTNGSVTTSVECY